MRKISEDPRSRPFLSSLFDSQSYIRTVVKDGKSEETFASIVACIEDINVEIKSYISQHKEDLMSGMQDVATLAERYNNLSSNAEKLQKSIVRLKKEAIESHSLVSTRTVELERIHETSILLHQLKSFARAKAQLDLYLASSEDKDIRTLSSAAKTLNELEKLLINPKLMEIKFVNDSSTNIKLFGKNIRLLAQDRLLSSITEKNQASIASSLQVFYNLQCLPEIVMMVIDISVKKTADLSREALDFDALVSLQPELGAAAHSSVGASTIPSTKKSLPPSANSSASPTVTSSSTPSGTIISSPQLLMAMREMGHLWSTIIHDNAMQIHSFQRVVAKKEDPTSHEKFLDVLKRVDKQTVANNTSSNAPQNVAQIALSNGQLLELFWHRLSLALSDVAIEKIRAHPIAASRAYPYLRKAAVDLLENLKALTERDMIRDFHSGSSTGSNFLPSKEFTESLYVDPTMASTTTTFAGKRRDTGYMFGSLQWSQNDLLSTLEMGSLSRVSARNHYNRANISNSYKDRLDTNTHSGARRGQHTTGSPGDSVVAGMEHNLVVGLKPIKDRFLLLSLGRMTAPIMQMFPEVEGYTAAIPSKRDLQALTKALQSELVTAVIESDIGLVAASCKEFTKATQLMLSKIEGMVINSPETRKISSQNSFSRTSQQEHNGQLFVLLMQFKDALEKIPSQVLRVVEETTGGAMGATTPSSAPSAAISADAVTAEMKKAVQRTVDSIDDLAERQITDAIVALLAGYTQSIITGLHKEGVSNFSGPKPTAPGTGDSSVDCSVAVQTLTKQVPAMLKSHLISSLPKCAIVDAAVEEVCLRMMHSYVTVAALCRPMSEALRLRTAKDMSSLEILISSLIAIPNAHLCPVSQEFKSYRRLLFMESEQKNASNATANSPSHAPSHSQLIQLPYINQLRPSTLLGYLISCAPSQLPSPHDVENRTLTSYVQDLSEVSGVEIKSLSREGNDLKTQAKLAHSVRSLYRSASSTTVSAWVKAESESKAWGVIQQCEDIFFQRITVADGAQKQLMRAWHDVIQDMGEFYFGGR